MILLPLTHRGRLGARIFGALALFEPPATPREHPIEVAITGTACSAGNPSQGRRMASFRATAAVRFSCGTSISRFCAAARATDGTTASLRRERHG